MLLLQPLQASLQLLDALCVHLLAKLRLLVRGENGEDLVTQIAHRGSIELTAGGMRLRVLIEQALDLAVLLAGKVEIREQLGPMAIQPRASAGGLLHRRRSLLRAGRQGHRKGC